MSKQRPVEAQRTGLRHQAPAWMPSRPGRPRRAPSISARSARAGPAILIGLLGMLLPSARPALSQGVCTPVVQWTWDGATVSPDYPRGCATLLVVQVTDDNLDGVIDECDTPDVVFAPRSPLNLLWPAPIKVLDGATGTEHFTIDSPMGGEGLAAGDIDGDGVVELLAIENADRVNAFEHTGELKWTSDIVDPGFYMLDAIGIADLDQDGLPEIFVGATVFDAGGALRWRGGLGQGQMGLTKIAHAVDLSSVNPGLELLAGNTLYAADGSVVWSAPVPDGWTAVGDLDGDGDPEVVLVAELDAAYVLDRDGNPLGAPFPTPTRAPSQPVVADFDGDGALEVVMIQADRTEILEWDGTSLSVKWTQPTLDDSRFNGSAAFDFDANGAAELVYHDEVNWYIFDGTTGAIQAMLPFESITGKELPVIADIDGDGVTEILVGGCLSFGFPGRNAVVAYECAAPAVARGIWNQYSYHVTNVNDDGTIPRVETAPWLAQNTWITQQSADPDMVRPVAAAGSDVEICAGDSVELDGSGSTPCDASGLSYLWLEDGTVACGPSSTPTCRVAPLTTTTYTLEVDCIGSPNPCAHSSDEVTVVVLPDPVPGAVGGSLRLAKAPPAGIDFAWTDLTGPLADYEIVAHAWTLGPPTPVAMDGAFVKQRAASGAPPALDRTGLLDPSSPLVFWKVRGTSPCSSSPGPTCNGFPAQVPCP